MAITPGTAGSPMPDSPSPGDRSVGARLALIRARFLSFRIRHAGWPLALATVPSLVAVYRLYDVFASRISYPMDIEWMEGGVLLHAWRILHGYPLYLKPGTGFMSFPYPPFHALLLAGLGAVFGLDYALGRFVSIAAITATAFLLCREVYRQFAGHRFPWAWPALAAGMIGVGYPLTDDWYDLIRSDSLAIFLPVALAVRVNGESPPTPRRLATLAAIMVAAVFTKQTCIFYLAWLVIVMSVRSPRTALTLALIASLGGLLALGLLEWRTHGYYLHYTFEQIRKHHVFYDRLGLGTAKLVEFAPYLALLPVGVFALAWYGTLSRRSALWVGMLVAAFPASLLPYAKLGGFPNDFLPVAVLAGPVTLCVVADLVPLLERSAAPLEFVCVTLFGLYVQTHLFESGPRRAGAERQAAAVRLNAYVARLGGDVLIPYFPYLAVRNGPAKEQFHAMGWIEATWAGERLNFKGYIDRVRPRYVLLSGDEEDSVMRQFTRSDYVVTQVIPPSMERAETFVANPMHLRYRLERRDTSSLRCPFDFESGNYAGWEVQGDAFQNGPSPSAPARQGIIIGAQGSFLASSFSPVSGDRATGTLISPEFLIDGRTLLVRVGGGSGRGTRVELRVDGAIVQNASGSRSEFMREVAWDTTSRVGRLGRIVIVDEDPRGWGHILVDAICWGSPGRP